MLKLGADPARRDRRQRRAARRRRRCPRSIATPVCSTTRWMRHPSIPPARRWLGAPRAHPLGAVRPGRRARPDPGLPARRRGLAAGPAAAPAAVGGCRHRRARGRGARASCSTCAPRRTSALGPVPAGVAVASTCGSCAEGAGRRGARAEPLQQARQGRARAPARRGSARASASRARLSCGGRMPRACVCATAAAASSSCSPEPGYAGVRTAANRLRRRSANPRRS